MRAWHRVVALGAVIAGCGLLLQACSSPRRAVTAGWPAFGSSAPAGDAWSPAGFRRAAVAEGVDTSTDAGLRGVVGRTGLDWSEAAPRLGDRAWEAELEENRLVMLGELGQWGVPSFRLSGPEGAPDFACWGQDRLWLLAREIQRRGART